MEDYYPAADLHCQAFTDKPDQKLNWDALAARADRVVSLQINDRMALNGAGKSLLLLAIDGDAPESPEAQARAAAALLAAAERAQATGGPGSREFPSPMFWLARPLSPGVLPGLGVSAAEAGVVGVAAVDSFCDLVPARELDWRKDGAFGIYRRQGYAYVSNVAVAASARRRGVARRLMAVAEALAAEWGCRAVGLHCNPKKTVPWALYKSLGYKDSGVREPPLMPYLQGRPPDRCAFLIKLVPRSASAAAAAAGPQEGAGGGRGGDAAASQAAGAGAPAAG